MLRHGIGRVQGSKGTRAGHWLGVCSQGVIRVGFRVQDTWDGHWPGVCSHGVVRVGIQGTGNVGGHWQLATIQVQRSSPVSPTKIFMHELMSMSLIEP